jgi:hypothetical protein
MGFFVRQLFKVAMRLMTLHEAHARFTGVRLRELEKYPWHNNHWPMKNVNFLLTKTKEVTCRNSAHRSWNTIHTNLIEMTNKMQLCRTIYYSIHCSLTARHVSRDIIVHHQELLNCNYSFWFYSHLCHCRPLSWLSHASLRQRQTWVKPETVITIQINHQPDATVFQFIILTFIYSSTCFGRFPAHHQELNDCSGSHWFYLLWAPDDGRENARNMLSCK